MYQNCQAPSSAALSSIKIIASGQRCQVAKTWLRALEVGPERAQAPSISKAAPTGSDQRRQQRQQQRKQGGSCMSRDGSREAVERWLRQATAADKLKKRARDKAEAAADNPPDRWSLTSGQESERVSKRVNRLECMTGRMKTKIAS